VNGPTTRGVRYHIADAVWKINAAYIEELQEFHGGDPQSMMTSSIEATLAMLSSKYNGNVFAMADALEAIAKGVGDSLREGAIPTALGWRH
jgi:hypothetical protein